MTRVLTAGRKEPQSGETRSAVVFLHGYGANGRICWDWLIHWRTICPIHYLSPPMPLKTVRAARLAIMVPNPMD